MATYFKNKELLNLPVKRAAFSDRTCYIMIEMSRLAYMKFEAEQKDEFKQILSDNNFSLIDVFCDDEKDAQAFLCVNELLGMAVLAFRGTEKDKLKDIITDVDAELTEGTFPSEKCLVHSGYWKQFESISSDIEKALKREDVRGLQLFITGHSLGGALAIIATKFFECKTTGACYTFGSPPVGTVDFDKRIHTPIYRIINHLDIVPYLPHPYLYPILYLLSKRSPTKMQETIKGSKKYRQSGYVSYLVGKDKNIRLRYSVGSYDKISWWIEMLRNKSRIKETLKCHSTDEYVKKIKFWAEVRSQEHSRGIL